MNCGDSRNNEVGAWRRTGGAVGTIVTDMTAPNITGYRLVPSSVGKVLVGVARRILPPASAFSPAKSVLPRYSMALVAPIASARNSFVPIQYETGNDWGDNETWCTGYNNDNFRSTYAPPAQDTTNDFFRVTYRGTTTERRGLHVFGSAHSGGVNMAYCDGHVDTVAYDIDQFVHRSLATAWMARPQANFGI